MALQVHKSSLAGGFRTRTGYRLTGTGSLKFGGLLIAGSATGLGGGTSVSKLLAAHWLQTLGPHDSQPGLEVLRSG